MSQTYADRPTLAAWNALEAGASKLVKLAEFTLTTAARTYEINAAQLSLADHTAALLLVELPTDAGKVDFIVNGLTRGYKQLAVNGGSTNSEQYFVLVGWSGGLTVFRQRPYDSVAHCICYAFSNGANYFNTSHYSLPIGLSAIETLTVRGDVGSVTMPAGTRIVLYGVTL